MRIPRKSPAHRGRLLACAFAGLPLAFISPTLRADIISTKTKKTIPGTSGITLAPGLDLSNWNMTGHTLEYANLRGANLADALFANSDLAHAALHAATLTNADFSSANLVKANFSGAIITGANFSSASGFTTAMLASTKSYKQHDLQNITLSGLDLHKANLRGQNLTNAILRIDDLSQANFSTANLTNVNLENSDISSANFAHAIITGADFSNVTGLTPSQIYATASYAAKNLIGLTLTGANLDTWNLAGQNLSHAHLDGSRLVGNSLQGINFSNASLTGTDFDGADLSGVNLTGASITWGLFQSVNGFTSAQFYSTASYTNRNLSGIALSGNDLSGWNFAGQNVPLSLHGTVTLNYADFDSANLTGAKFYTAPSGVLGGPTGQSSDLSNASFINADLTNANLTNANLRNASFINAIFSGATIGGACLAAATGFTPQQLYSTASYLNKSLDSVNFAGLNLAGANFANVSLVNASFSDSVGNGQTSALVAILANVTGADFTGANLVGAHFEAAQVLIPNVLTNTNFTDADLRDAFGFSPDQTTITTNTILPDGSIHGLSLAAGETLTIRNHGLPITVSSAAAFDSQSTLRFLLSGNWLSTISFDPGLTPSLSGTLDLELAAGTNPSTLIGHTFQLFTWNAPLDPSNTFTSITTDPALGWDLSHLYTTGKITLTAVLSAGAAGTSPVPEPTTLALLLATAPLLLKRRKSRH